MKAEHDILKEQRDASCQPRRDGLDWISKYLELADKMMQNHPPELSNEKADS